MFLVAVEDIEPEEELFSIPHSAVLSDFNSDLQTYISDDLATLDSWLRLVLVMVYESGKGQASKWWPYWRILPHEFDTLIYWSPTELRELQGSAVVSKIGKDAADEAFVASLLPLVVKHADLFGEYATDLKGPAAKDFFVPLAHRMASLVMAYAFDIEQDEKSQEADEDGFYPDDEENPPKGMVPLADMLNADAERNNVGISKRQSCLSATNESYKARLYHDDISLSMVAGQKIKKGDEIFNDYGALPRSDLLRRYGYVTDRYSIWDVVELDAQKLIYVAVQEAGLTAKDMDKRVSVCPTMIELLANNTNQSQLAQDLNLWDDAFDISREAGDENLPNEGFDSAMLQLIHIFTANQRELREIKFSKEVPIPSINILVAKVLSKALADRQSEYITSIAEDTELLKNSKADRRHQMAIEVRLGEKLIIANALSYLNRKRESLSANSNMNGDAIGKPTSQGSQHAKRRKL